MNEAACKSLATHRAGGVGTPFEAYGKFVARIRPPLGIGTIQLAGGEAVKTFSANPPPSRASKMSLPAVGGAPI